MTELSLLSFLKSGTHFGHQKAKWHPKMAPYIFGVRNGVHIIDLEQTLERLQAAQTYVRDIAQKNGVILYVGTKRQAKDIVRAAAERAGMPYVTERWLGGLLTNFDVVHKLIAKLRKLKQQEGTDAVKQYTKKEQLQFVRERERLEKLIGGIESLDRPPDALYIVDAKEEQTAVKEANKKGIPIVAMTDTNVNPEAITQVIPANDDATKSIQLLTEQITNAIIEGVQKRGSAEPMKEEPSKQDESIAPTAKVEKTPE